MKEYNYPIFTPKLGILTDKKNKSRMTLLVNQILLV